MALSSSKQLSERGSPQRKGADQRSRQGHSLPRLLLDAVQLPPSIIVSSVLVNLMGLALPLVILQIFDRVLRNQSTNTLALLIGGLIGVIIIEAVLRLARNTLLARATLRESFDQQMFTMRRFLGAQRTGLAGRPTDQVFDSFSAADDITSFFSGNSRLALLDAPFVLLFVGMIWLIGGPLALLPAGLIVVFVGWTIWSSRRFKRALETQIRDEHQRFSFYAECLSGIATVKSLAIEPRMERRIEGILRSGTEANYTLVLQANRMIAGGQLFASATMISIVTVGGYLAIHGGLTLGAVAACTLIANRVTQPVVRIVGLWGQMEAARLARDRAQMLHDLPQMQPVEPGSGAAEIILRNIAMPEPNKPVSSMGVSLCLSPGSITGFACRYFAERSQFQDILRGRRQPEQGEIMIDGVDLASEEGAGLAEQTYFVGDEPVVMRGTILENIAMFRSGVWQIKAVNTARRLGVDDFINALPDGYETRLGQNNAADLSRELLRALDVVRAVATEPRILIMQRHRSSGRDIAALASERAVEELRGRSTIILTGAHPDELAQADHVYALYAWRVRTLKEAEREGTSTPANRTHRIAANEA